MKTIYVVSCHQTSANNYYVVRAFTSEVKAQTLATGSQNFKVDAIDLDESEQAGEGA